METTPTMNMVLGSVLCFLCVQSSLSLKLTRKNALEVPKSGDPFSDNYIDQVLANLRDMVIENSLDPAELPDAETGFSDSVLGVTFRGSAKLYNGKFWGTSARLTAYIGISGAHAHYDAKAEFMGISVHASADADVSDIQIYLDATMDLANLDTGLQLQEFHISHIGNIDVDFDGLGPLDWILGVVVDFVDAFLKDWLVGLIEGPLKDLIQSILDDIIPDIPSKYL